MNIPKFCHASYRNSISKLRHAHTVAKVTASDHQIESLQKQDVKASKKITGIENVVSLENYSPLTHVTVAVQAGPRYESIENLGLTHALRNAAVLASKKSTSFGLTRMIEKYGGKLCVSTNREFILYTLECLRDHVNTALPVLGEICSQQAFKPWEVSDASPQLKTDLTILQENHEAVLIEALHKAAFKNGLSNSLYTPSYMIGKHSSEMLHDFIQHHYTNRNTVVAGLGIDHEYLEDMVLKYFGLRESVPTAAAAAKFRGGEVRIDAGTPVTRVAIVSEGAGLSKQNEVLSRGVLQCILGTGPATSQSTTEYSVLGAAAGKQTANPFTVSSLNISYSDTGMFGVYIAGHPDDMRQIVKAVVAQMRESTKKLSDEDVAKGKHAFKAMVLFEMESSRNNIETMAMDTLLLGAPKRTEELLKAIDALSAADVNSVAAKIMKSKPAMASLGKLHNTPYLDELI